MASDDKPEPLANTHVAALGDDRQSTGGDIEEEATRLRLRAQLFGEPFEPLRVGRFALLERIGAGAMGVVHAGYDDTLNRKVAIKLIGPNVAGSEESRVRMLREAQALAKLSHPNVVQIYEAGMHDGQLFIAMEFVKGQTLREWATVDGKPRPWREVLEVYSQAGRGLAAAHKAGLVHRDFKPDNAMIDEEGAVRVMDFGLARAGGLQASDTHDETPLGVDAPGDLAKSLTRSGALVGTPAYMAPEQLEGREADARSDQFSFCVSLWEALYGERPFRGKTINELAANVAEGKRAPQPRAPEIPPWLIDTLERAQQPNPNARWPSMAALLDTLAPRPRRQRAIWAAVATLGTLTAVVGARWALERAELCSGASGELVGVWDGERRQLVRAAFLAVEASFAVGEWERIGSELDAYAEEWARMYTDSCEATRRGEQSIAAMDLRMTCLRRAKLQLRAVTGALTGVDFNQLTKAHKLVAELRGLDRCADVEALQADVEPPTEADAAPVEQIRARLAEASALRELGKYDRATLLLDEAKDTLVTVDYEPVKTEIALVQGQLLGNLGDHAASESLLRDALRSSITWKQWPEARQAANRLFFTVGVELDEPKRAMEFLELAQGFNTHGDATGFRNSLAIVLAKQEKFGAAEAEFRAVVRLREEGLGPGHVRVAMARNNLALALWELGRFEESEVERRAAEELWKKALGPNFPHVVMRARFGPEARPRPPG